MFGNETGDLTSGFLSLVSGWIFILNNEKIMRVTIREGNYSISTIDVCFNPQTMQVIMKKISSIYKQSSHQDGDSFNPQTTKMITVDIFNPD